MFALFLVQQGRTWFHSSVLHLPYRFSAFCYLRFLSIFRWLTNLFREVECSARLSLASDPNGTCSERHLSIVLQIPGAPTLDEHSVNSAPEKSFVWLCSNSSHSVNAQTSALNLLPYSLVPLTNLKADFKSRFVRIEILCMVVRYRNDLRSKRHLTSQKMFLTKTSVGTASVCRANKTDGSSKLSAIQNKGSQHKTTSKNQSCFVKNLQPLKKIEIQRS